MTYWEALFCYSLESPSKLVNRVDRPPRAKAGTNAGYQREDGYWLVGDKSSNVLVHRIIYEMFHGEIPEGKEIDHIDGNPANNVIEDLRMLDKKTNQRNMRISISNSSGYTGVSKIIVKRHHKVYEYWTACWESLEGKAQRKNFSIEKYGDEEAKLKAIKARSEAIVELNAQGAGYTERHGKC